MPIDYIVIFYGAEIYKEAIKASLILCHWLQLVTNKEKVEFEVSQYIKTKTKLHEHKHSLLSLHNLPHIELFSVSQKK